MNESNGPVPIQRKMRASVKSASKSPKVSERATNSPQTARFSESEFLLRPACSSSKVFDEVLIDCSTQSDRSATNELPLPGTDRIAYPPYVVPEARMVQQQPGSESKVRRMKETSKNLEATFNNCMRRAGKKEHRARADEDRLSENKLAIAYDEPSLLSLSVPSDVKVLSCFDEPSFEEAFLNKSGTDKTQQPAFPALFG